MRGYIIYIHRKNKNIEKIKKWFYTGDSIPRYPLAYGIVVCVTGFTRGFELSAGP